MSILVALLLGILQFPEIYYLIPQELLEYLPKEVLKAGQIGVLVAGAVGKFIDQGILGKDIKDAIEAALAAKKED